MGLSDLLSTTVYLEFPVSDLSNEAVYPGYACLYFDPGLRRVYGDLEFGLYSTERCEGLVEFFAGDVDLLARCMEEFVSSVKSVARSVEVAKIVLAESPDGLAYISEPSLYRYYNSGRSFVEELITTALHVEPDEKLRSTLSVYSRRVLAKTTWREPAFKDFVEALGRAREVKMSKGSFALYSHSPEAIPLLYRDLVGRLLKPLSDRLSENEEKIREKILKVITGWGFKPL